MGLIATLAVSMGPSSVDATFALGVLLCVSGKSSSSGKVTRLKGMPIWNGSQMSQVISHEPKGTPTKLDTIPMVPSR